MPSELPPDCHLKLTGNLMAGRKVLITGAASERGIGQAAARLLVAHGANVVIADRDADAASMVARDIGALQGIGFDAAAPEACLRMVDRAAATLGGLDVLVNNVGVTRGATLTDTMVEEYDLLFDVNVRSTFFVTKAALPALRQSRQASVICMGSVAGQRGGGLYGTTAYSASKAAVLGLGKALARELAPKGIRVNAIAPALIDTDARNTVDAGDAIRERYETLVPLGRSGTKWEVASAILFLASDMSSFMTGSTLDVNGGFHIH